MELDVLVSQELMELSFGAQTIHDPLDHSAQHSNPVLKVQPDDLGFLWANIIIIIIIIIIIDYFLFSSSPSTSPQNLDNSKRDYGFIH
jgi:hypothetical protein